jgi:hypothetical protein
MKRGRENKKAERKKGGTMYWNKVKKKEESKCGKQKGLKIERSKKKRRRFGKNAMLNKI